jgi:hypothetical protein
MKSRCTSCSEVIFSENPLNPYNELAKHWFDTTHLSSWFKYRYQVLNYRHDTNFGFEHNLVVFPYHQITLRNLVDEFLAGSRSNPTIIWENTSLTTNPRMKLGQNFRGIQLNISITPIQTSLTNIQSWLKQNLD